MELKGSLGIKASPVSAAGFPQDSDMFLVLVSHLQLELESQWPKSTGRPSRSTQLAPRLIALNLNCQLSKSRSLWVCLARLHYLS